MGVRKLEEAHDPAEAALGNVSRMTVRQHLTLSILWLALNLQSAALLPIVLPVQILPFVAPNEVGNAQQATLLAWLTAVGGLIALVVAPVAGALSDRTTATWGRRRPYILVGALLLMLGAWVLATPRGLDSLLAGLLLFQLGGTICTAGYQGLLPDQVPLPQRGAASGYIGLMTILGNVGSLAVAGILLGAVTSGAATAAIGKGAVLYYTLTTVALGLGVLVTVWCVHETPVAKAAAGATGRQSLGLRVRLRADWIAPWQGRDFRWVWLTRASVMLGLSLFMTFIVYYFGNVDQDVTFVQQTVGLAVLALGSAATSALVIGILSDRIGRVVLVCFATACMALAALGFVVLPPGTPLWPLGLLFGLGYGAYSSVDWALAVDVLPSADDVGKDMGIWSIATTLPAVLAPFFGGLVLAAAGAVGQTALGYRVVFALAVLSMAVGALCILIVRDTVASGRMRSYPRATEGKRTGTPKAQRQRSISPGWRLASRAGAGRARGFLHFWPLWERVTLLVQRQTAIPNAPYGLLKVHFTRYRGRPMSLPDGTLIRRGDLIGELHIQNRLLPDLAPRAGTWQLVAMFASDLQALAAWTERLDFPAGLHALYGFTLLARGAARLGFTVRQRPHTLRTRLDCFFLTGLLALYNPNGVARLRQGTTYGSYPVEIWMSREELRRRYR
jgi:MFS family permease